MGAQGRRGAGKGGEGMGQQQRGAARQRLALEGALLPRVAVPPPVSHKSPIIKIFDQNTTPLIDYKKHLRAVVFRRGSRCLL